MKLGLGLGQMVICLRAAGITGEGVAVSFIVTVAFHFNKCILSKQ